MEDDKAKIVGDKETASLLKHRIHSRMQEQPLSPIYKPKGSRFTDIIKVAGTKKRRSVLIEHCKGLVLSFQLAGYKAYDCDICNNGGRS